MTKLTAETAERVDVYYFGHSAFLWTTSSGARILIDPYGDPYSSRLFPSYGTPAGSRWFLEPFPPTECDVVLVTHPHFDHDAIERVNGAPTIVRDPLELQGDDFRIRGFMGRHAGPFGKEFGQRNVIFVIEVAGLTFCHLGDNQAEIPEETLEVVGEVDVLMVAVDDENHLLSYEEVDWLIVRLDPKIVIPTHYLISGLTDPASSLGGIESWLTTRPSVRRLGTRSVELSSSDLPERQEVWTFEIAYRGSER